MPTAKQRFSVRSVIEITGGITGISMILGGWLYVDSYFAKAADLGHVASALEQSQIQLRIDILEDRIDRETEKLAPNQRRIDKMNNQIHRLEERYKILLLKETN